jgi:GT2 family glycosyltransferase
MTFSLLVGLKNNLPYTRFFYEQTRRLYPDLELVFVSYGSTDGTHAWLDALRDERVRYHHEPTARTLSDTYNTAAALATSDYVVFAHNDLVLAPGFVEALAECQTEQRVVSYTRVEPPIFADDPQPGKLIHDFGTDVETFQREAFFTLARAEQARNRRENRTVVAEGRASFFLSVSRRVLLEMGGLDPLFDPMFCEDDDLLLRFRLLGLELLIAANPIAYHFVSKTSRFSDEYQQRTAAIEAASNRNFIRKWGFPIQAPVQKTYDVGVILTNARPEHLREIEPWCTALYTDLDPTAYLRDEQPRTAYDLRAKIRPRSVRPRHGVLVWLNPRKTDPATLATLPEAVAAWQQQPRSALGRLLEDLAGGFRWRGLRLQILDPTPHETSRIRRIV